MNKTASFIHDDFLLQSPSAQNLYHDFAKGLPIIDYHNHLSPSDIATDRQYENITEIWLEGDHYKWRAMRANGISEHYITGNASDKEKFCKWAETVPFTMRNPLYHWTHFELLRYFQIDELLSPKNASRIYEQCSEMLSSNAFSTKKLLTKMNVEVICTTDNPGDSLIHHKKLSKFETIKILPTFRPDNLLGIELNSFGEHLRKLSLSIEREINSFTDLINALRDRIDYFHSIGCRLSDHGLPHLYSDDYLLLDVEAIFTKFKNKKDISAKEGDLYRSALLHQLALIYYEKEWTMQLHLGPLRNNNSKLLSKIGSDAGCDSIGDKEQALPLSKFLDRLDKEDKLCQTILYNLNPRDNEVFATMAGNFQDGSTPGKIQWGSAWWFLDQKNGMEKQIDTLSNMGLLSRFIGMLTDSRSFLSFPRHEYFRRILCNKLGDDIAQGLLPNDIEWIGSLVQRICYTNAKEYFRF